MAAASALGRGRTGHRSCSRSFSFHIHLQHWFSRILDSGWDTSPRWDNGAVEAVDLNAWLRVDQLMLAWMARALGRPSAEVVDWQAKADATAKAMMDWLWSEQDGVFWDRLPASREWVKVVTPATFWSLLAAVATPAQAAQQSSSFLNAANLLPKFAMPCVPDVCCISVMFSHRSRRNTFHMACGRCVGVSEPRFEPTNYWRGPVWVNVNWLSAVGFDCYGHASTSAMLRRQTTALVAMHPTPREYYDPLTGDGLGAFNFMWTGAIDIIIINEQQGNTLVRDVLHAAMPCPGS